MDELISDFEQIMPLDEFNILQDAYNKKNITLSDIDQTESRYRRYIIKINDWSDRNDNDYSYVKVCIQEFLKLANTQQNFENKKNMIKYIDGEIMMMINMCRIQEILL
uniref:Uncharacterized protein n=1 Tax=viral metagenome TaxID=1070528 RepID=A0A6C0JPN1_9ZZZZ